MNKKTFHLILLIFLLIYPVAAQGTTYYASPTGSGSGISVSTPFQIIYFWKVAKSGDTLILLNGTYKGYN